MHQSQFLLLATLFALTSAVPLNINLGAYSPAFVVGDGEISLGGKESATQIMGALQGAAVTAAGANAAAVEAAPATSGTPNAEQANAIAQLAPPETTVSVPVSGQEVNQTPGLATGAGLGNDLEPRIRPRISTETELLDEADLEEDEAEEDEEDITKRAIETDTPVAKRSERIHARDLAGFDRALNYATTALTTSPKVSLGTGEGGSGVGIIQEAGINNGGPKAAAAPAAAPAEKREVAEDKQEKRAKVTTVYIRELPEPVDEDEDEKDDAEKRGLETAINVDVSKARTVAMTFVEEE